MSPTDDDRMTVSVLIEIPKGSRNKYEYDPERDRMRLDRQLYSPVHYPTDYGFVEETLARDGDPLDALVLVWEPTFPGCLVEVAPVGLFRMRDEKGEDEKVLCVPVHDPHWSDVTALDQVPAHLLDEVEHFFEMYKKLEEKPVRTMGWDGREAAVEIVRECRARRREKEA